MVTHMNLDTTISTLRQSGYRMTKTRKQMLKIFSRSLFPLSANQVEEKLCKVGIYANKATIYRELRFLVGNGYLIEIFIRPNEIMYESSKTKHHHHLVCDNCGRIEDVTNCLVKEIESDIYEKTGFKIKRHVLEFYGICSRCMINKLSKK